MIHESRLRRHCEALRDSDVFDRVEFLGSSDENDQQIKFGDGLQATLLHKQDTRTLSLLAKLKSTREWGRRAVEEAVRLAPDCITCHSLPVLPVCVKAKRRLDCKLMYEPHELETETVVSRGIRQHLAKFLERRLIKKCDATITVCQSISEWYAETYRIKLPDVVRNLPKDYKVHDPRNSSRVFREKFKIPDDENIFLYQGYLGQGRRIKQYLEAFKSLSRPYHIVFMGDGHYRDEVFKSSEEHSNIHYQPAVPADKVLRYTASADIGLCGVENACLSYYFSLPNKIFEYLSAGIPSVVPDFPEMGRLINETKAGWLHGDSLEELLACIKSITPESSSACRNRVAKALSSNNWDREQGLLVDAYRHLMQ